MVVEKAMSSKLLQHWKQQDWENWSRQVCNIWQTKVGTAACFFVVSAAGGYDGAVLVIYGDSGPPSVEDVSGTAFMYMPPLQVCAFG